MIFLSDRNVKMWKQCLAVRFSLMRTRILDPPWKTMYPDLVPKPDLCLSSCLQDLLILFNNYKISTFISLFFRLIVCWTMWTWLNSQRLGSSYNPSFLTSWDLCFDQKVFFGNRFLMKFWSWDQDPGSQNVLDPRRSH